MRPEWEPEELVACWTLIDTDWELVANKAGATRLGFALLLKFFELEARFPRDRGELPQAAVDYVAEQVGVAPAALAGYWGTVIAPANPLRSLVTDSAYLSSVISTIEGPVVMVGHSYGGAVISNASVGHRNVKALVYVAGFAPDRGETLGGLVTMNPGTRIGPNTLTFRPFPLPGGGEGQDSYIKAGAFRDAFAGDLPKRTTKVMAATQRPFAAAVFEEPSGTPAWESVPSWYLVATDDRAIPPATQRFMARRARARTVEVKASHVPMMSRPRAVTRLVLEASRSVR
jgi:pimeloyl-ACP methyl ester carboxylesterase